MGSGGSVMGEGDRLIINTAPTPATIMLPPNNPGTHQSLVCFACVLTVAAGVVVGVGFGLVCAWDGEGKLTKPAASRAKAGRQGANS